MTKIRLLAILAAALMSVTGAATPVTVLTHATVIDGTGAYWWTIPPRFTDSARELLNNYRSP